MPIYVYKCPDNHTQECFRSISDRDLPEVCKVCGQESKKIITTVGIQLEPFTGDFPDAAAKWERHHAEKLAWEIKHERQHDEMK